MGGGDQLGLHRGINAEKTRVRYGRGADSNVNPFGPRPSDHLHDLSARGGPYDGVINYRDSLPLDDLLHRVQFDLDAEMPDGLPRFDKRSAHIVVSNEPKLDGDLGLVSIADGRGKARIGGGNHDIRLSGLLPGQLSPQLPPNPVNVLSEDEAVGTGEIDEFKYAMGRLGGGKGEQRGKSSLVDHHHLPGLDLPLEFGAYEIEGTGLRGHEIGVLLAAQDQGPKPMGIAYRYQFFLAQEEQTVGPLHLLESPNDPAPQITFIGERDQVNDDLRVHG